MVGMARDYRELGQLHHVGVGAWLGRIRGNTVFLAFVNGLCPRSCAEHDAGGEPQPQTKGFDTAALKTVQM